MKKFLNLIVIGALLTTILPQVSNAGGLFIDVANFHPNIQAITSLKDAEIVVGYGDGSFGGSKNINRAEFLKIVMEAADIETKGDGCFKDVKDQWFAPYICAAKTLGFIDGYKDGYFRPEQEINFAEASKIITNVMKLEGPVVTGGNWFDAYVGVLDNQDVIPVTINSFDEKLTRNQMAEMIWRIREGVTYKLSNSYENIKAGKEMQELGAKLANFESCTELKTYFEMNASNPIYSGLGGGVEEDFGEEGEDEDAVSESAKSSAAPGAGEGEYSETNVQVKGVDEADIVKNDGKYIYWLKDNTVRVIEAYPASSMKELSKVTFDDENFYPSEMFLDDDRLVVIGTSYDSMLTQAGKVASSVVDIWQPYNTLSKVYIFNIANKSAIKVERKLSLEGSYVSSRKVGDKVYLVANDYNYYWPWGEGDTYKEGDILPLFSDSKTGKVDTLVECNEVQFVPGVVDNTSYMSVLSVDIDSPTSEVKKEVVLGSSSNIYASTKNLYIAQPKYDYWEWYDESGEGEQTYVHKFGLSDLSYKGVGTVPGSILNQFSMDEDGEYFRIATTTGDTWSGNSKNNLYVLGADLKVAGSVTGLAPGERIYSVRFIGDRAYMVTYEETDPLFVIGLDNPTVPVILGQLKIPGFSNYLHPYGENYLIGFGKETTDDGVDNGFSWVEGMKIAMFDVTDVNNPKELHRELIGDRGTYSELLYNHKALLFNEEKGYMAFPITVAKLSDAEKAGSSWVWGDYIFQGAHVYDISVEDGFELRGTITHYDAGYDSENYWSGVSEDIQRILYIGDHFYTLSNEAVKANLMSDLKETKRVDFAK